MTTADRIDQASYRSWVPSTTSVAVDKHYLARHRRLSRRGRVIGRSLSLHRMFYSARHRAR